MITNQSTSHHRRSIRLKDYDYSQPGAYFITICTHDHAHLFGEIVDGQMHFSDGGGIANACWQEIPDHFPQVELDEFIVMPNHIHGILWIVDDSIGGKNVVAKNLLPLHLRTNAPIPHGTSKTIGSVVRGFKIGVTKWFRQNTAKFTVWQRNYYEHIIRNEHALNAIRRYIAENPLRWHWDRYNADRTAEDPLAREIWEMIKNTPKHQPSGK